MVFANLRRSTKKEILSFLQESGQPSFRLKQLRDWVWVKGETSFEQMSNLGHPLIEKLKQKFHIPELTCDYQTISNDGTIKIRFKTEEGHFLESVYIPSGDRNTLCVSSQIGCSLNCRFCATAQMDRKRNLFFDEIFDQFRWGQKISTAHSGNPLTNLVFMGMGEPLLNYNQVLRAINLLSRPQSFDFIDETEQYVWNRDDLDNFKPSFSPKRITLSTAGVVAGIRRLGDDQVPFELALSLHAPNDETREKIMMNNTHNNLSELHQALHYFYEKTGSKVTLEYLLLSGVNDDKENAQQLVKFYRQVPAKLVNVIEFNSVPGIEFSRPNSKVFDRFITTLESRKVNVRVRRSRGKDIAAACGQLANTVTKIG